jgi:hypothetical protein
MLRTRTIARYLASADDVLIVSSDLLNSVALANPGRIYRKEGNGNSRYKLCQDLPDDGHHCGKLQLS